MVIAIGSYPIGRRFESHRRYQNKQIPQQCGSYRWPRGQAVKTSPFHGGNTSSILVGVTKQIKGEPVSFRRRLRLLRVLLEMVMFLKYYSNYLFNADMLPLLTVILTMHIVCDKIHIITFKQNYTSEKISEGLYGYS